jgi:hypothetical protein
MGVAAIAGSDTAAVANRATATALDAIFITNSSNFERRMAVKFTYGALRHECCDAQCRR